MQCTLRVDLGFYKRETKPGGAASQKLPYEVRYKFWWGTFGKFIFSEFLAKKFSKLIDQPKGYYNSKWFNFW